MSSAAARDSHRSPDRMARALRALLASHNFRATLLSTLTLLAAVVLWIALRAVAKWLALLAVTVVKGTEARPPTGIGEIFWLVAACLLALAWIDARLHPDDRPRDHRSPREIAWDFLLTVPRLTLAVWGTLSTWQRLDSRAIADAVALVELLESETRIPLSRMPLEIPNADRRFKVLFALQILKVIEIQREDRELCVRLSPLRPRAFMPAPVTRPDRPPAFVP